MPKKPAKANAYSAYIYDMIQRHRCNSFQEAQTRYGAQFQRLSQEEKQRYTDIANKQNGTKQKLTTTGVPVEEVVRVAKEREDADKKMKLSTEKLVADAIADGSIKDKKFYIAYMHYYCYRHGKFYPAELGAVRFSISRGIEKTFNRIIQTGQLPMGSAYDALEHSNETHQLPTLEQHGNNIDQVLLEFEEFLMEGNITLPPIFVREQGFREKNVEVVQNVMSENHLGNLKVWVVEYLLFQLKNQLMGSASFPVYSLVIQEFTDDKYDYLADNCCDFHENCDWPSRCSQSIAARCVYLICDHVCEAFDIELQPGRHLPKKAKIVSKFSSRSSVCSGTSRAMSSYSTNIQPNFETDTETLVDDSTQEENKQSYSYDYSNPIDTVSESSWSLAPSRRPRIAKSENSEDPNDIRFSLSLSPNDGKNSRPGFRPPAENLGRGVGGVAPRGMRGRGRAMFMKQQN